MSKKKRDSEKDQMRLAMRSTVEKFWEGFFSQFGSEELAQAELWARCLEMKEPCCKRQNLRKEPGARSGTCANCHAEVWFSSGTFFEGIRNCTAWLAAILCFEERIPTNPTAFSKRVGCAPATGWEIFHKLRMVIDRNIEDENTSVEALVFADMIKKRSRETPARKHPIAELDPKVGEDVTEDLEQDSVVSENGERKDEITSEMQLVFDALTEEPLHTDVLAQRTGLPIGTLVGVLVQLEIAGMAMPLGSRYVKVLHAQAEAETLRGHSRKAGLRARSAHINGARAINSRLTNPRHVAASGIKRRSEEQRTASKQLPQSAAVSVPDVDADISLQSLQGIANHCGVRFHGVSAKYLQLYIAGLWGFARPDAWPRGALFKECLQQDKLRREDLLAYISPTRVLIPYLNVDDPQNQAALQTA